LHLGVSSFNGVPFSSDYVTYFANFTLDDISSSVGVKIQQSDMKWPNEVTYITRSLINNTVDKFGGLIIPGGFLVPTKTDGGIYYFPFKTADRSELALDQFVKLSAAQTNQNNWFYHHAKIVDINGDGDNNDILTCRAYKPILGSQKTELVAFVHSNSGPKIYTEYIISDACDVFFEYFYFIFCLLLIIFEYSFYNSVVDLDNDGRFEIIAAGFFISELNIIYTDDENNNFLNGNAKKITIDNKSGKMFSVQAVDLDLDSKLELLVTNHQGPRDLIVGALFYYKLDGNDFRNSKWTKFTIYNKFPVVIFGNIYRILINY
jgi:hypothetical protein